MKLLLQFANGVAIEAKAHVEGVRGSAQPVVTEEWQPEGREDSGTLPVCFVFRTAEGAIFYFEQHDILPSGLVVYQEAE